MDVPDKPIDPKEVEMTHHHLPDKPIRPKEVEMTHHHRKKKDRAANRRRGDNFWTHVGWDGVLVMLFSLGIAGLFVCITFFVYEELSCMASTRLVGLYGLCGVVCSVGVEVFMDLENVGNSVYGTATGEERKSKSAKTFQVCYRTRKTSCWQCKNVYQKFQINGQSFVEVVCF